MPSVVAPAIPVTEANTQALVRVLTFVPACTQCNLQLSLEISNPTTKQLASLHCRQQSATRALVGARYETERGMYELSLRQRVSNSSRNISKYVGRQASARKHPLQGAIRQWNVALHAHSSAAVIFHVLLAATRGRCISDARYPVPSHKQKKHPISNDLHRTSTKMHCRRRVRGCTERCALHGILKHIDSAQDHGSG